MEGDAIPFSILRPTRLIYAPFPAKNLDRSTISPSSLGYLPCRISPRWGMRINPVRLKIRMKGIYPLALSVSLLVGCSGNRRADVDHDAEIRETMTTFLDKAIHEFTDELGSWTDPWGPGDIRWEEPYVESGLLSLASMEYARLRAFDDGLKHDRADPPQLKPPTPRSLWLPIPAEGSYTFQIDSVSITGDTASATVQFTMHYDEKTYPEGPVEYRMHRVDGRWRIANVVSAGRFNLKSYLERPHVMKD